MVHHCDVIVLRTSKKDSHSSLPICFRSLGAISLPLRSFKLNFFMTTEHNERLIELRVTLDKFISLCKKALFSDLRYTIYVTGVESLWIC